MESCTSYRPWHDKKKRLKGENYGNPDYLFYRPGATISRINQAVGFRLLTKFGETGVVNLGKAVPILGGIIGGAVDEVEIQVIRKVAINTFL
jgi:hypothetical protein